MESEDVIELNADEVSDNEQETQGANDGGMFEDEAEEKGSQLLFEMDAEKGADFKILGDGSESNVDDGTGCDQSVLRDGSNFTVHTVAVKSNIEAELCGAGTKRPRVTYCTQQPAVHVTYNFLTRKSKKQLGDLMQQWSEWHAQNALRNTESPEASLESGEETYFPALHVGAKKTSTVAFWMDNQARLEQRKENSLDADLVPLYDRGFTLASASTDGSGSLKRDMEAPNDPRCFNCGSYSHSLKECPKPRDNVAINNARVKHNSKRKSTLGSHLPSRYYQTSPGGKFKGIKPGILGAETRQCLGIGEHDPPPWLNRMREIGYPPGYIDVDSENQPSGITIYTDEKSESCEDGEILDTEDSVSKEGKKMTVDFPGINASIPENADSRRWASSSKQSRIVDLGRNSSYTRSNHSESGLHFENRSSGDYLDEAPPGTTGHYSTHQQSFGSFKPSYMSESDRPRGHNSTSRSPILSRSYSEKRWSSMHDNLHGKDNDSFRDPGHSHGSTYYGHRPQAYSSPSSSWITSRNYSPTRADPWGVDDRDGHRDAYADADSSRYKDRHDHRHLHRR